MAKEKSSMPLLAFIGIVAVVAVVALVLNLRTLSSEEALAGEASKGAVKRPEAICNSVQGCGLKPVYLTTKDLNSFYGIQEGEPAWQESKSGEEVWRDWDFKGCLASQMVMAREYYGSSDSSCSGLHSRKTEYLGLWSCQDRSSLSVCLLPAVGVSQFQPGPGFGDVKSQQLLDGVFCLQ